MRLLAGNLRALRHLNFYFCRLDSLDETVLDPFPEFGARLHSLTFYRTVSWVFELSQRTKRFKNYKISPFLMSLKILNKKFSFIKKILQRKFSNRKK